MRFRSIMFNQKKYNQHFRPVEPNGKKSNKLKPASQPTSKPYDMII